MPAEVIRRRLEQAQPDCGGGGEDSAAGSAPGSR
jgi:hypothetical protein